MASLTYRIDIALLSSSGRAPFALPYLDDPHPTLAASASPHAIWFLHPARPPSRATVAALLGAAAHEVAGECDGGAEPMAGARRDGH
jgi:hypothetical protein